MPDVKYRIHNPTDQDIHDDNMEIHLEGGDTQEFVGENAKSLKARYDFLQIEDITEEANKKEAKKTSKPKKVGTSGTKKAGSKKEPEPKDTVKESEKDY